MTRLLPVVTFSLAWHVTYSLSNLQDGHILDSFDEPAAFMSLRSTLDAVLIMFLTAWTVKVLAFWSYPGMDATWTTFGRPHLVARGRQKRAHGKTQHGLYARLPQGYHRSYSSELERPMSEEYDPDTMTVIIASSASPSVL